ncbi:MAG: glycosyltransferase family 2 protein [Acidilobus sp.]
MPGITPGTVSVVTSTLNESRNLPELARRVREALRGFKAELIVVDGGSIDGTQELARDVADRVIVIQGGGQTRCLLEGIRAASSEAVVTIDADLENPPELIPSLLRAFEGGGYDLLVARRGRLPRTWESIASATLGRAFGVRDVFSNFRVYRRSRFAGYALRAGETYGCELLEHAWASGMRVGVYDYEPTYVRPDSRVGWGLRGEYRALRATLTCLGLALRDLLGV